MSEPETWRPATPSDIRSIAAPWHELLDRIPQSSFFNTPEWAAAWLGEYGEDGTAQLAVWWSDDRRIEALAHVVLVKERLHSRLPFRVAYLVPIGTSRGGADHAMFPTESHRADAVRAWLEAVSGRRSLVVRGLAPWANSGVLPTSATQVGEELCMSAPLPLPVSTSFRKKITQYERRLEREGIDIQLLAPGQVTVEVIEAFGALQAHRREAMGRSTAITEQHLAVLRALTVAGHSKHGLAAVAAHQGDTIVGVLLGFATANRFEFFQIGWDPQLSNLSIGTVMIARAAAWARSSGSTEFDFLRGVDEYKARFGASPVADQHWLTGAGISGRLLRFRENVRR
jgi:CelD/BcsL family acetyltransferase involved in cellulose biosynthesis